MLQIKTHLGLTLVIGWTMFCGAALAEEPPMQVRSIPVGNSTVEVVVRQSKVAAAETSQPAHWLLVNLHDDENTSVEAALQVLGDQPCRFVELKHSGEREVVFKLESDEYRCDPNRIFTAVGVAATLKDLSVPNEAAEREVARLGQSLIEHYRLDGVRAVIALHNNTDQRYSASSYARGQEYESDASAVHVQPGSDPDDFFFVTKRRFFDELTEQGFNVVLQNNESVTDDGSLSVYCGKRGIPYINVEAQHGHLDQQVKMLRAVLK